MSLKWVSLGVVAAMMAFAEPAATQSRERANLTRPSQGYTYYNRPGSTIEEHNAEVRACAARAAGLSQFADNPLQGGLLPMGLAIAQDNSRGQANIENCMIVNGWRVIRLPDGLGQRLFRMRREELSTQLATVVGVETPDIGRVTRIFNNEAARGDTIWGAIPDYYGEDSLSLKAVDLTNLPLATPSLPPLHPGRSHAPSGPAVPVITLTPENIANLPEGTALAIVRVVGTGRTNGEGLGFGLVDARTRPPLLRQIETDPVEGFHAAVRWTLFKGSAREVREKLIAVPIVPGDYRVESRMSTMDYCLGAPVTTVREGDVVFFGAFDIAGQAMGPDMDLEPARTFLANDPNRLARLRPAEWRNGHVSACSLVYFYALEFPGAPFEPGYSGGSNFRADAHP